MDVEMWLLGVFLFLVCCGKIASEKTVAKKDRQSQILANKSVKIMIEVVE